MDVATTKLAPLRHPDFLAVAISDSFECIPRGRRSPRHVRTITHPQDRLIRRIDTPVTLIEQLSPVAMLVLRKKAFHSPVRVATSRFHDYNADIALLCYEFIVCSPGRRARLEHVS